MNVLWIFGVMLAGLNAGLLVSGLLEGHYLQRVSLTTFLQMHQPRDLMFRRIMPPLLLALMACCLALVFSLLETVSASLPWPLSCSSWPMCCSPYGAWCP